MKPQIEIHDAEDADLAEEVVKPKRIPIPDFDDYGITAFMTTRNDGSFALTSSEPVSDVMTRWTELQNKLAAETGARSVVIAPQVHGTKVLAHTSSWQGLLRTPDADGHITNERGIALCTTVADCVPVFMAHHSGAIAILHSGWRGTAAKIIHEGIRAFGALAIPADEIRVHLGPSICGRCYEVDADTREQLTGQPCNRSGCVDLRSIIAEDAKAVGVQKITVSDLCTSCNNDVLFSFRKGETGRQLGVIVATK